MQAGGQGGIDPAERPQVGAQAGGPAAAVGAGAEVVGEIASVAPIERERGRGRGEVECAGVARHRIASAASAAPSVSTALASSGERENP